MLLDVSSVGFSYVKSRPVLRDVSFAVNRGERVGLVGPNGSGKSTLIRLLADLLQLRSGRISMQGRPHRDRASRRDLAYSASNDTLPQFLTGQEYVDLMHRLYGQETDAAKAADLFRRYDMAGREGDLIEDYSHGMRKKVQVIASLLVERPLTIIDETLNGVDADAVRAFTADARRLGADRALVFCSHDLRLIEAVCDRVILLVDGTVRHDLSTDEVFARYGSLDALVAEATRSPASSPTS
ncbi:ATP-binding cassette domain-containing protein [Microbacterium sp. GCS4]|uniref:ATP-binding cassette domain-containing protein n=1 Tax=Microbacterium sp. GCS4 TaxID=1692239 RepID=UPI000AD42161|nr:ABC transporter ATP-binding protein [Microbacterium sp. GCS4]